MKIQYFILVLIAATAFAVVGCKKAVPSASANSTEMTNNVEATNGTMANGAVNIEAFTAAFQAAEGDLKTAVDSVVNTIDSTDYAGALSQLKTLGDKFTLSGEQQTAVNNLISQVQKTIENATGKAMEKAGSAAEDMQNAMQN